MNVRSPLRSVLLVSVLLAFTLPSSTAQVKRRYVLGETASFTSENSVSLAKSDFVAAPKAPSPRGRRVLTSQGHLSVSPTPRPGGLSLRLDSADAESAIVGPVLIGLVGGTLGAVVGGYVGSETLGGECEYTCFVNPIIGGVIGETVGLSSGVYLATRPRGSYVLTLLGGAAATAATLTLVGALVRGGVINLSTFSYASALAVPIAQFAVTIPITQSDQ